MKWDAGQQGENIMEEFFRIILKNNLVIKVGIMYLPCCYKAVYLFENPSVKGTKI